MTEKHVFDLEERTFKFAKNVSIVCRKISKNYYSMDYIKQLIRSSSSVGANYIEANECLGKKDFLMRIKICLKEVKESMYWIKLLLELIDDKKEFILLYQEAMELKKIFSAILSKSR